MVNIATLLDYLEDLLQVKKFQDYSPNGLQVEGKHEIKTLVTGVSACEALFVEAIKLKADAILVHHGFFWKNETPQIIGIKKRRMALLLKEDINLLGYHLPLDAHLQVGNNVQLAEMLGIECEGPLGDEGNQAYIFKGYLKKPLTGDAFAKHIHKVLQRTPLHIPGKAEKIETLAWCTGAGQSLMDEVISLGVDAYLSGEISEHTVHPARENGLHYFACGHHATERYGIKALGEHLAERFDLKHHFVDIDNPV